MPVCPTCRGLCQIWEDYADQYVPCDNCNGTGEISQSEADERRRKQLKRAAKTRIAAQTQEYRIQVRIDYWSDWDTIAEIEWRTIRTVLSRDYGLALVLKWNSEDREREPFRLVAPNGREVNWDGTDGRRALAGQTFPLPGER